MQHEKAKEIIDRLMNEIEEEDIGICLFSTCYQNPEELKFFKDQDRERVCKILQKISEDSRNHKKILGQVIAESGQTHLNHTADLKIRHLFRRNFDNRRKLRESLWTDLLRISSAIFVLFKTLVSNALNFIP